MLIKLLATKIVANNFSLLSKSESNKCALSVFFSLRVFKSAGLREKYATSEPDMRAEAINSKTITTNSIALLSVIELIVI